MFNNSTTMSPADFAAMSGCNNGWGNDSSWFLWIIVILALFNGGTWSNSGGVQDQYTLASDFATLQRQIDSTSTNTQNMVINNADQLQRQVTAVADGIASLGYDQLSRMNGINTAISSATYDLSAQLNNIAATQQSCCCTTNNNLTSGLADLNYNLATQSCNTRQAVADAMNSIVNNDNANYRALDAKLTNMEMNAKDEKIADLQAQISALNLAASQQAQNNYLIGQLKATPVAAYTVPNPYTGTYGYTGCSGCSYA